MDSCSYNFWRLFCFDIDKSKNIERCEKTFRKIYIRVVDVYDGDTFTVIFVDSDKKIRRRRCRCVGYDSPEMKGESKDSAMLAKSRLKELLPKNPFLCETKGFDKYGRLLVDPKINNEYLSKIMIREKHGYEYFGGKKIVVNR